MGKKLIVNLIGAQTIPNVLFIKQFGDSDTDYLFISTKQVAGKQQNWICKASRIQNENQNTMSIIVGAEDFKSTSDGLSSFDFSAYDRILVNITGGTKVMSVSVMDFFKSKPNSEIYYITPKNELLGPYPDMTAKPLTAHLTLSEYLDSYGFTYEHSSESGISADITESLFLNYLKLGEAEYHSEFLYLRERRGKNGRVLPENYYRVSKLITALGYVPEKEGELSKHEVLFLTGEWFEEYVWNKIKTELQLSDDDIWIGTTIYKDVPKEVRNNVEELLDVRYEENTQDSRNEMDVLFMYHNKFYSIECKTSLLADITIDNGGTLVNKKKNILGETIYKSDSLQSKFGLHPNTFIVTLTDFRDYIEEGGSANKTKELIQLIGRANLSNITLIDRRQLQNDRSSQDILKIK